MGTDIHPYLEIKCGGKWRYVPISLESGMNYELFGFLSGVRGDERTFDERCVLGAGIPDDASKEVEGDWEDGRWGHTPTVLYVDTLRRASVKNRKELYYAVHWWEIMEQFLELGAEDARVILWYDS